MSMLFKGCLAKGQFLIKGIHICANGRDCEGLNELFLFPPSSSNQASTSMITIFKAELFLGEFVDNLTKVDITVYINTTIMVSTGLVMWEFFLLCQLFTQVQRDANTQPSISFLFQSSLTLSNIITVHEPFLWWTIASYLLFGPYLAQQHLPVLWDGDTKSKHVKSHSIWGQ